MSITHNRNAISPRLQAFIVEPILLSCINNMHVYEIDFKINKMPPMKHTITTNTVKRYLFYLVEYGLVLYNGQKRVFTIEDAGFDLLDMIDEEKRREKTDLEDTIITLE